MTIPFCDFYNSIFETVPADTEALIDECYRLRYRVYCIENPYERPDPARGEYERDDYDGQSLHALLRHRQSGEFVGTVRVIRDVKDSPRRIPAIDLSRIHGIRLPDEIENEPCGEVSRFCIAKSFRRRITDNAYTSAYSEQELTAFRNRVIPFMAMGLVKGAYDLCRSEGLDRCCAVMEPALVRMLDRLGIHFRQAGDPIDYHGQRVVTHISYAEMRESLSRERPEVLELMTDRALVPLARAA